VRRIQLSPVWSSFKNSMFAPTLQKSEGFRFGVAKGEAVVDLLRSLGSAESGVLRLSRRVKKMEKNRTYPGSHQLCIPKLICGFAFNPSLLTICEIFFIFFMQLWGLLSTTSMDAAIPMVSSRATDPNSKGREGSAFPPAKGEWSPLEGAGRERDGFALRWPNFPATCRRL